ncbi:MAG TPA: hypothetical protein VMU16_02765 [Candidatus Binataceae bacterium]|nr:hypothetical protein [Candidatus Binataceae bacterium]
MKRLIGLTLAAGLVICLAGCAAEEGGAGGAAAGGEAVPDTARNFNLAVKCPGIHWQKSHGWSNEKIMEHESVDEGDIDACEKWEKAQEKGYVPAAAGGGAAPAAGAPAPAAAAPAGGAAPSAAK